jgi:hypothetical protein
MGAGSGCSSSGVMTGLTAHGPQSFEHWQLRFDSSLGSGPLLPRSGQPGTGTCNLHHRAH